MPRSRAAKPGPKAYGFGTFAFGPKADLETIGAMFSAFVRAFCPPDGLAVRATRGARSEVLPSRFSRTASVSAAQLARGGSVELSAARNFDDAVAGAPLFWIASEPGEPIAVRIGFSMLRPPAEKAEQAIAQAMSTMAEAAVEVDDCLSAIVHAQDAALTLANDVLACESLGGRDRRDDASFLRTHVRGPGWRVFVPRSRVKTLSRPPPDNVTIDRFDGGVLVKSDAPTPFAMEATDDLERWLAPLLASGSSSSA